ncbi:hypothetical protein SSX86_031812 [Deinandra increscens subsp. villosa]|uniref:Histone-lysine N-methyltransferase n=1 Tax=Deinandra increscens subsp. villosa TaxID=3103831 RepID=A0AAP0C510_9ASTR
MMVNKDSGILPAENAHYPSCDFNELVSTMEPNYLADALSAYLEPCELFPVIDPEPEPCNNVDRSNICKTDVFVDPFNSNVLIESSDLRNTDGKDSGKTISETKRSSNRKSTRKSSSNQKNNNKLAARKSRRNPGKRPMVDLLAAFVGRGQRSNLVRRARPSAWGFVAKIDEIFTQNAEKNMDIKGITVLQGGKRNTDYVNKNIQKSEGETKAVNKGLLLKLKLGKMPIQNCQFNTIPDMEKDPESYREVKLEASNLQSNIKENYEKEVYRPSSQNLDKEIVSLKLPNFDACLAEKEITENRCLDPGTSPDSEVINVIPDTQVNGNITEDIKVSSKDCISHQSDDCGVASGMPSPETVSDVLLCEKKIEGSSPIVPSMSVTNSSREGCPVGTMTSFHQTEVRVPMDMLTVESLVKDDRSIAGIESVESRSNGPRLPKSSKSKSKSKSSVNNNKTNCHQKASPAKSTAKENIKEKSGKDQMYCDRENQPVTGLLSPPFGYAGTKSPRILIPTSRHCLAGFLKHFLYFIDTCYFYLLKIQNYGSKIQIYSVGSLEMNDARGLEEGFRSTAGSLSNSIMVPRSAWVCCDDCHKWRRISAILADNIELTGCRWVCKDNMDKDFADCSIPQEKSNADINEELEISEASCEEDACNNTRLNSSQLAQKQPTDPPQPSWKLIKTNMFLHRNRKNQPIDEVMVCHCKPPIDGRMGCRDECLNRMLNIECVKGTCPCGDFCSNQQFQKRKYSKLKCFPSGKKGFGLQLQEDIPKGRFLIEYVGEVLDMLAYEARQKEYASKGHKHFYFMTLNGSEVIDACAKGNLGRFINHSCQPNCRTEKWMVNGEVCIGLFAIRDIKQGEELTFDYNYVRVFGAAAKKCVCGSSRCRGVIGGDPVNDETVVLGDSDDEYPEPVKFYESNNNKSDNTISVTVTAETNLINDVENNQSPDSLFVTDEKNDDLAILSESTEREVSFERSPSATSASESKLEHNEGLLPSFVQPLDTSFKVKNEIKKQNENITSVNLLSEDGDSKKKPRSHTNDKKCTILKPKSRSKVHSSPPAVKKGKSRGKQTEIDTKPPVAPQKPKKLVVDNLTGRFGGVEDALNILLTKGGISKRRDAWKGYLKLLCLTANGGNGEGIQSNRDLSMILDALLRTKSRTVLLDIINKNGLQMLHILLKRYRKVFNKTPILRKLLKVLEYLAETKILTVDKILKSSHSRVESFKESILSLTEHADKEVHQIARNFRDRYIPWSARRVHRPERDTARMEFQENSNSKSFPLQQRRPSEVADNPIKQIHRPERDTARMEFQERDTARMEFQERDTARMGFQENSNLKSFPLQQRRPTEVADNPIKQSASPVEVPSASCLSSCTDGTRTRKRKSRWDQPGDVVPDLQSLSTKEFMPNTGANEQQQTKSEAMDVDAPPGFCPPSTATHHCKPVMGQPQDRYISRLPTAFGLPCSLLKKLGTTHGEGAPAESWIVAPGMTFHPFPPLPVYPRSENRHVKEEESWRHVKAEESWGNPHNFHRDRNPNTLGRRYFKQQKWNYSRSSGGQQWNPNKYGPAGSGGPNRNQPNMGVGYGGNETNGTYNTGNSYYQQQQQQQAHE